MEPLSDHFKNFLLELGVLLDKYNATISLGELEDCGEVVRIDLADESQWVGAEEIDATECRMLIVEVSDDDEEEA